MLLKLQELKQTIFISENINIMFFEQLKKLDDVKSKIFFLLIDHC